MRSRVTLALTSLDHGHVERSVVELVLGVHSGSESDQQLGDLEVALVDGDVEGSVSVLVLGVED